MEDMRTELQQLKLQQTQILNLLRQQIAPTQTQTQNTPVSRFLTQFCNALKNNLQSDAPLPESWRSVPHEFELTAVTMPSTVLSIKTFIEVEGIDVFGLSMTNHTLHNLREKNPFDYCEQFCDYCCGRLSQQFRDVQRRAGERLIKMEKIRVTEGIDSYSRFTFVITLSGALVLPSSEPLQVPAEEKKEESGPWVQREAKETKIHQPQFEDDSFECCVCFREFQVESGTTAIVGLKKCGHALCAACCDQLKKGTQGSVSCPLCREESTSFVKPINKWTWG